MSTPPVAVLPTLHQTALSCVTASQSHLDDRRARIEGKIRGVLADGDASDVDLAGRDRVVAPEDESERLGLEVRRAIRTRRLVLFQVLVVRLVIPVSHARLAVVGHLIPGDSRTNGVIVRPSCANNWIALVSRRGKVRDIPRQSGAAK